MGKRTHNAVRVKRIEQSTTTMPLIALILLFTGIFVGYFGARLVTPENAHPTHWAITVLVAVLGYVLGMIWYHVRGDITL